MKVLIVASYNLGYFAAFITEQAAALENLGCEVKLFGISKSGVMGYLQEIPRLRKEIRSFEPNVIHAHFGLSCMFSNIATRKIPIVSTYHGSDINLPKLRCISELAMSLSAWNIFVSNSTLDKIPKFFLKNSSLVPCGIDLSNDQLLSKIQAREILGWNTKEKKVLFAGRFNDRMKDAKLAKETISLIDKVELIELKGYTRREVNYLMCAVDCLLLTSIAEASPQVVKEAMACGCPIVSVDVGDVAERTSGVEGCFVVPTRNPKDIATAVETAISFEGKTNGRKKIIEYGLTNELVAKRLMQIYEQL